MITPGDDHAVGLGRATKVAAMTSAPPTSPVGERASPPTAIPMSIAQTGSVPMSRLAWDAVVQHPLSGVLREAKSEIRK